MRGMDAMTRAGYSVVQLPIPEGSPFEGHRLGELSGAITRDLVVMAVLHGDRMIRVAPREDHTLHIGDMLIAFGEAKDIAAASAALRGAASDASPQ